MNTEKWGGEEIKAGTEITEGDLGMDSEILKEFEGAPEAPLENDEITKNTLPPKKPTHSFLQKAGAGVLAAGAILASTDAHAGPKDMFDELEKEEMKMEQRTNNQMPLSSKEKSTIIQENAEEKTFSHSEGTINKIKEKAGDRFEDITAGEQMIANAKEYIRDTLLPTKTDPSERAKLETIIDDKKSINRVFSKAIINKGLVQFTGLYFDPISNTDKAFIFEQKIP